MDNIKITIETNAEQAGQSFEKLSNKFKNADNSAKDLRKEIRELKNELFTLTPGTEEYSRVLQELGVKMDQLQETTQQLRAATGGLDTVFQTTTSAVGSLAAGFTAASGVVALFGGDTEDLQKTFVKLQAVMAVMTGLKGFAAFTKESKKAWISLKTFTSQSLLATKAVIQQTTATSTLNATQKVATISTNLLTAGLKKMTAAIASNPFGAMLIGLTAVITLMSRLNKLSEETAERQKELSDANTNLYLSEKYSYKSLEDYYNNKQVIYDSGIAFYEAAKKDNEIYIKRLKSMGATEEEIAAAAENFLHVMDDKLRERKAEAEKALKEREELLEHMDVFQRAFIGHFIKKYDGTSLEQLQQNVVDADKAIVQLNADLTDLVSLKTPESFNHLTESLKQLGNVYAVDMAAGLKTQGDYLQAQINVYHDAIDDLYDENGRIKGATDKEKKEKSENLDLVDIYEAKIRDLEQELKVYNAGLQKKANDEAKKAAEALNKNFKKLSTDITDKADEYKDAWEKALKGFADMGNFADDDLLNGNQSMARALTELNRYTLQLDEYCDEWVKGAEKAKNAGEITEKQYQKLVKHVEATRKSMIASMKESLGAKIPDSVLNAGMEVQKIVENFKKQNDRMLEALAGGLVSKEEYADFLTKRTQEYKQEIADKMPDLQAEIRKAIEKAKANNEDTTALEAMYGEFTKFAENLVPPSVVQQINTTLKEMIDKEFSAVEREYDVQMSALEKKIHDSTYGWLYGDDGNIKSGDSLVMKLLFGQGDNPKAAYEKARKQAEEVYNLLKAEYEEEIKLLEGRMSLLDKNSDQYQEYADKIKQIQEDLMAAQQDMEDKQVSAAEDYADKLYTIADKGLSGLSSLAGAMGAYYQEQAENAKAMYGENSEEYKKYLKKEGNMKIAQVWTDAAAGIMTAWATSEQLGPIAGPILAAIQTAALTATAIASTQQIKRQTQSTASGSAPTANVSGITDRVIMGEAQNADQTAQLNADYSSGATRVYVTQSDLDNGRNTRNVAVTQNTF